MPLLVAYDYSGSTEGSDFYHDTVQKILKCYDTYDVVLWDHNYTVSSKEGLARINRQRDGRGGTQPINVAQYCFRKEYTGDVILITDGQILERDVKNLDDYLEKHGLGISHIDCYLIQTCSSDKLDATVIAPFIRRYTNAVYLFNKGDNEPTTLATGGKPMEEFIEELRAIKTIATFEQKFDELFSEVVSKLLGMPSDLRVKDELLNLRQRLINEIKQVPEGFDMKRLEKALADKNVPELLKLTSDLFNIYTEKYPSQEWPGKIFHLLRMCTGNLSSVFSLSALTSRYNADRVRRADIVQSFEIADVDIIEDGEKSFICPVSYEAENDVVILVRKLDKPLIDGLDNDTLNPLISNPLQALNNEEFLKKMISAIDHPISLRTMREAEASGAPIKVSPFTRAEVIGGLCLGADENHSKVTRYIISKIISGGKRVGNPDLWFAVYLYLVETGRIPFLNEVLPQMREHMRFLLLNHKGTLTMTSVPFFPITTVPLGISCWFSLNAISAGIPEGYAFNLIKPHSGYLSILRMLNDLQGLKSDQNAEKFLRLSDAFIKIYHWAKHNEVENLSYVIKLGFNTIKVNLNNITNKNFGWVPLFVPIDGNEPTEENRKDALAHLPQCFSLLTPAECRAAARTAEMFNPNKMTRNLMSEDIPASSWSYKTKHFDIPEVPICPVTLRPYTKNGQTKEDWRAASERIFGKLEDQIHIHYLYLNYVEKYNEFPTKDDFLVFVFHRFIPKTKFSLPMQTQDFIDCVFSGYEKVFAQKKISAAEFNKTTYHSAPLVRREHLENGTSPKKAKKE